MISLILPVHRLHESERLAAFRVVMEKARSSGAFDEIIVVEQVDESGTQDPFGLPSCVKYIAVARLGPFCKAALCNRAALQAKGDWLWVHDADILLPFKAISEELMGADIAVQPFGKIFRLNAEQSQTKVNTGKVRVALSHTAVCHEFAGGSFIIRKYAYVALRGMDETFVGWGSEDIEFGRRCRSLFFFRQLSRYRGCHLWHKPVPKKEWREYIDKNRKHLKHAREMASDDMVEYLDSNFGIKSCIPRINSWYDGKDWLEDTAIVLAAWDCVGVRKEACIRAVNQMRERQQAKCLIVIVELVFPGQASGLSATLGHCDDVKHIIIQGSEQNKHLFQKEALYNIGVSKLSTDIKYLVFLDNDCWMRDRLWSWKLRHILIQDKNALIQGFHKLTDTKEDAVCKLSFAWQYLRGKKNISRGPGLSWAMTRDFYDRMGGWNPWLIPGSGDSCFVLEHLKEYGYSLYPLRWPWWNTARRNNQPQGNLHCLVGEAIHENHGPIAERAYEWSRRVITWFTEDVEESVELDTNGVLAWRDMNDPLRVVLGHKSELQTSQDTIRIVSDALEQTGLGKNVLTETGQKAMEQRPSPLGQDLIFFRNIYTNLYENGGWKYDLDKERLLLGGICAYTGVRHGGVCADVGCGQGYHTEVLRTLRFDVTGYDLCPLAIQNARRKFPSCQFVVSDAARLEEHIAPESIDFMHVRGLSWFHYELTGRSKSGVNCEEALDYLLDFITPSGIFLLVMGTNFSGERSNQIHHNKLGDYFSLLAPRGQIVGVFDWSGKIIRNEQDAVGSHGGIMIALKKI